RSGGDKLSSGGREVGKQKLEGEATSGGGEVGANG
ncbi:hypothetical protein A2U01_0083400, partial [Trifolium medium]|nr:hypothetical protein [Trifolium medium]